MTFQTQHAKVLRIEVSVGSKDADRTIEQYEAAVKKALGRLANNVTVQGAYYIIDGKVCLPDDYDAEAQDRKPGTFPPPWAGGPDPKKQAPLSAVADEDDRQREFVRVRPTQGRRDPITGQKPRKPRSDKGVKRGPRNQDQQVAS